MTLPVAAVAVTVLSWAAAFPLIRLALADVDPIPLAAIRFAVAALFAVAWLAFKRPKRPTVRDALRFAACGAVGISLYNILLNTGQQTVSAGAASFIVNTLPIITALLSFLVLRERLTVWAWAGMVISFCGIGLIAQGQPGGLDFGAGSTLVLAAAGCSAVYFVIQRPLVPVYGALNCAAYTLLAGALLLAPWAPVGMAQAAGAPGSTGLAVLTLGVFPAALGYATWTYALGHYGAARAANFLYLVPPVATALAVPLVGEWPTLSTLAGGALAIAGVVVVNTRGRDAAPAKRIPVR